MTARYVTRTGTSSWLDDHPLIPDCNVDESKKVNTGLVDRHGNSIIRLPIPVGFGRDKEW